MNPRFFTLMLSSVVWAACLLVTSGVSAGWRELGPKLPGRLNAILTLPENVGYGMVGASGGGIWATTPSISDWIRPANVGLEDFHLLHLAWDRQNPGRIYASTPTDLYASINFGDNWTNLTGTRRAAPLWPVANGAEFKPFAHMLSGGREVVLWSKACSGLYYSTDGQTFAQHFPFTGGVSNPSNCISAIAADDATGHVYIALAAPSYGNRIFRSSCSWWTTRPCTTWAPFSAGLPQYGRVVEITWRGTANRLAAALPTGSTTLIVLSDDGDAWRPTDGLLPQNLAGSPRSMIAVPPHQLILGALKGFQTTDNGERWWEVFDKDLHPDVRSIYWDAPHGLLWFTTDGHMGQYNGGAIGFWKMKAGRQPTDGVVPATTGLNAWQAYVTTVAGASQPGYRRRFFSGSQDNDARCSDNLGLNWEMAGLSIGCSDIFSIVLAPSDPNRGYARSCDPEVFARTTNALSAATCADVRWETVRPRDFQATHLPKRLDPPGLWNAASIAVHSTDPDRVAFATGGAVSVSSDGGNTWSSGWPLGKAGVSVAFLPPAEVIGSVAEIVAGTAGGGLVYSGDGGQTWSPYGLNQSPPAAVLKVEVVPPGREPLTIFAATTQGLYRKVGPGEFVRVAGGPGRTVSDVEVDPTCYGRVYIAHGYTGPFGMHGGGVDFSEDGGSTFVSLTRGHSIHYTAIPDIEIDPLETRFLYAATYGQGSWRYETDDLPGCIDIDP